MVHPDDRPLVNDGVNSLQENRGNENLEYRMLSKHGYIWVVDQSLSLIHIFLLVFVGTITGVGGGILRDVLAGETPYTFVKHVYACASIAGALFYILLQEGFGQVTAMFGASALVILLRFLAAHYKWNLPRLKGSD